MSGALDISHQQSAGAGDVYTTFNQTFGGAGSPLRPSTIPDWLVPTLWVAGAAALAYVALRWLRKG